MLENIFDCMKHFKNPIGIEQLDKSVARTMSIGTSPRRTSSSSSSTSSRAQSASGSSVVKRPGKRPGRKPSKVDEHAKLERSRQSARECRARKKLRYQYLEELVLNREKAVFALRDELETFQQWCVDMDQGIIPVDLQQKVLTESPSCHVTHDLSPDVTGGPCADDKT